MTKCKCNIDVRLLLPLVKILKIQFGVTCFQWIVKIYYWVNRGCITRMELMGCATIYTHLIMVENKSHSIQRNQNRQRRDQEKIPVYHPKEFSNFNLNDILSNWGACMECGPVKEKRSVLWSPPHYGVLKFNVDGASRIKLGPARIGVLRNSRGEILLMFSKYVGV